VKIEGKNVQLLGDPMLNNCGPSGNPPNSATLVGVLQGPDLVALWGDEKCPICDKAHKDRVENQEDAQIKESGATKEACGEVQSSVPSLITEKNRRAYGMIGAVECLHGQVHVAQSAKQQDDLRPKLSRFHHFKKGKDVKMAKREARFSNAIDPAQREKFSEVWDGLLKEAIAQEQRKRQVGSKPEESRNRPGCCAGQHAMLLAIDHGCRPKAMTERLAKGKMSGRGKVQNIAYREVREDGSLTDAQLGSFGGTQAVPPCKTCQTIITALMCNQLDRKCTDPMTSGSCGKC
jgi:hypothetical protein